MIGKSEIPDAAGEETRLTALLARIARRDEGALTALHHATAERMYALAMRVTGRHEAAEEAMADAYFQIWQQAPRYDCARGRALTWILTIAHSRALDWRRRQEPAETHPFPEVLSPDQYRDDRDPLDLLLAVERNGTLHAALRALDSTQLQLLSLAFFQDLTHREIAVRCALPLGTVKSLLRRTVQSLRPALTGNAGHSPGAPAGRYNPLGD